MDFNIVQKLLGLTLLGTEWILWLLLALSVISVAIMIERAIFFARISVDFSRMSQRLTQYFAENDISGARAMCEQSRAFEAKVVLRGLENINNGPEAMAGSMEGFIVGERQKLDRGLVVLGTLGNNAPFIGLFGTVIGIIMAVDSLAKNLDGGFALVMTGISEALVATAVGLIVAIPAVVAFNFFNRIVKRRISNSEAISKITMTFFTSPHSPKKA
jgi:biopolymer transport protein ExbB